MDIPRWRTVDRTRKCTISYKDEDYVKFYDLDSLDFEYLVMKLKNGLRLTEEENDRYGIYILTISLIVQEHRKFKQKPISEKEEMLEQQYMELLEHLTGFNPEKGKIYSYSYRIAFVAACHYFTQKIKDYRRREAIEKHCTEELEEYLREISGSNMKRHGD